MSQFAGLPENAYRRRVAFAAEVLDAVTLSRITDGLLVRATAMQAGPVVNWGGLFVWLDDGKPLAPQLIVVDPGRLPYAGASVNAPLPPSRLVQIELAPGRGYGFRQGVTALRVRLVEAEAGPAAAVARAEIWLSWIGPGNSGTTWTEAPGRTRTDEDGEAALFLRFRPKHDPARSPAGSLRARLSVKRGATVRVSDEILLAEGRAVTWPAPFAWDKLKP